MCSARPCWAPMPLQQAPHRVGRVCRPNLADENTPPGPHIDDIAFLSTSVASDLHQAGQPHAPEKRPLEEHEKDDH